MSRVTASTVYSLKSMRFI